MTDHAKALQALLRSDFPSFIRKSFLTLEPGREWLDNWHVRHIAWQLGRVASGEIRRAIINIPPRYAKSLMASVAWPALLLGLDPSRRIICISHTRELARTHSVSFRNLVEAEWYRQIFPDLQGARPRSRDLEFITSKNGYRAAFPMTGAILGRGADIIIVDDPMRGEAAYSEAERRRVKEVFDGTISTRLNDKEKGAIVIVMQRLHADDLVAHVLVQEGWEMVSIPAIATEPKEFRLSEHLQDVYHRQAGELLHSEREGPQSLEVMRRRLGSLGFSAQYQQEPVPQDGSVIRRDWLRYYDTPPGRFDLVITSWDTASTLEEDSDYSVGTAWGLHQGHFYLLEVVRGRFEVPELRRQIIDLHERHHAATTIIEKTALGHALLQELRSGGRIRPILKTPRYDKQARMLAQSPKFEAGQVLLPREAPWLASYLSELLQFPRGRHDDQVDSTSQALRFLSERLAALDPIRPAGTPRPGRRSRL
jgi:predicted phage terminase large subunit-like protein